MERVLPVSIVAVVVLGILTLMLIAWRRRASKAEPVSLASELDCPGERRQELSDLFYVATTFRDAPLERVAIRGLRFRGFADVSLFDEGIVITVRGEAPCAIPRAKLTGVTTQQLTIDKVVEPNGLIAVHWMSALGELSSVFRVQQPESRADLLSLSTELIPPLNTPVQEKP